jgi:uncharacterized protein YbjT (DUF2867 family)
MTSPTTNVLLIVGASGYFGGRLLHEAWGRKSDTLRVVALSRSEESDAKVRQVADGVEIRRGDLMKPSTLREALTGVTHVIASANGYMSGHPEVDIDGYKNLMEAIAETPGFKRLVLLSILNADQATSVPHFYNKHRQEQMAAELGIPYVSVRAPAFIDMAKDSDYPHRQLSDGIYTTFLDTEAPLTWVHTTDLARALTDAAIVLPDEALGWHIAFCAMPPATGPELRSLLSDLLPDHPQIVQRPAYSHAVVWLMSWFVKFIADARSMLKWMDTGKYCPSEQDQRLQQRFFGPAPTLHDSWSLYLRDHGLI